MNKIKKILVVDDDVDLAQLLVHNLEKDGAYVVVCDNGLSAIWCLENGFRPDLILLDLMMPSPNGFEVATFLKETPVLSSIPLAIMSAKGNWQDLYEGFKFGADYYLPKPFPLNALRQIVSSVP